MTREVARVEGVKDAQAAFAKVGRDLQKSADGAVAAGEALVPYIAALSRRQTGAMAEGWGVDKSDEERAAEYMNSQFYWTFQEFGTVDIDPMNAITQAWQRNEDVVLAAYDETVKAIAEEAGFEQ